MSSNPSPVQKRRARILRAAQAKQIPLPNDPRHPLACFRLLSRGKGRLPPADVVLLMMVGRVLALVLNPAVAALQRWKVHRRGYAVAIVTIWGLLVFAGLAVAFGYPLVNGITHLADNLPAYVNKATHSKGWIGRLARQYHVQSWVQRNSPKLVSLAKSWGSRPSHSEKAPLQSWSPSRPSSFRRIAAARGTEAPRRDPRPDVCGASRAIHEDRWRSQPVGRRLHARRHPHLCHRRARHLRHPDGSLRAFRPALGALGRALRLPARDRRGTGRHTDGPVRVRSLRPSRDNDGCRLPGTPSGTTF